MVLAARHRDLARAYHACGPSYAPYGPPPDLANFAPAVVIAGGQVVARDGVHVSPEPHDADLPFRDTVKIGALSADDFRWRLAGVQPVPDGDTDLTAIRAALLTIIERHGRAHTRAAAPLLGFDLGDGAVATTYSHDSHNLTTIGTSRTAMALAANAVIAAAGGIAVVHNGAVTALLKLPVGGLMSDRPVSDVVAGAKAVRSALHAWDYRHANAFMSVSTLSLPVSPSLKLTDQGLVNVDQRAWADAVASHL